MFGETWLNLSTHNALVHFSIQPGDYNTIVPILLATMYAHPITRFTDKEGALHNELFVFRFTLFLQFYSIIIKADFSFFTVQMLPHKIC